MTVVRSKLLRRAIAVALVAILAVACDSSKSSNEPAGSDDPSATTGGPGATNSGGGSTAQPIEGVGARLFPIAIIDPAAENRVAFTFLAPDGWSYEGAVRWLPEWVRTAFLQTRVSDPVSGVTVEWLPIQDFIWFEAPAGFEAPIGGNYQGKMYVPPVTDPAQFVNDFWLPNVLAHLQGATLVSVTNVPQIAEEFRVGFGGPADAGAWRLRYEYDLNGARWEEDVSFALLWSGTTEITRWYANFAWTVRGPKGTLEPAAGLTSTIYASRASTPEWESIYRLVQQLFNQGQQQQMNDTAAFGRTLAAHRAETQALQAQVVAERQASQDRIAEIRRETLGGVATYTDPFTAAPIQLPLGYNTYWVNERGEYLISDQAGFNPNSLNAGTFQQLQLRQ